MTTVTGWTGDVEQGHEEAEAVEKTEQDSEADEECHLVEEHELTGKHKGARARGGDSAREHRGSHFQNGEPRAFRAAGESLVARMVVHVPQVNGVVHGEPHHDDGRDRFGDAQCPALALCGTQHRPNDGSNGHNCVQGDDDVLGGEDECTEGHRESDCEAGEHALKNGLVGGVPHPNIRHLNHVVGGRRFRDLVKQGLGHLQHVLLDHICLLELHGHVARNDEVRERAFDHANQVLPTGVGA
mmetsp:Transcript_68154/g.137096  ORF Transcript_68154/g.137096 Transcript_68154/m.137096 type:complete len:242 (+) Transcript_68154:276-1001(+)